MRKKSSVLVLLILMIATISMARMNTTTNRESSVIYVDDDNNSGIEDGSPEHPYNTIQEGVDAVSPGGTVRVASGAYYGKVVIYKKESISLIGEDSRSTIIDGQQTRTYVLKVNAENVTITGFLIRNSTREPYGGILLHFDAAIYGNVLEDNYIGIKLHWSDNSEVSQNLIRRNYKGIYLVDAEKNLITNNSITNNSYGIFVEGVSFYNNVTGNRFLDNEYGMYLKASFRKGIVSCNCIYNNSIGIWLRTCAGENTIFHNSIIENSLQVKIEKSNNTWNNEENEGNFWSDYWGVDDGTGGRIAGDGIGDTRIPHRGLDYYPLMEQSPCVEGCGKIIADAGLDQTVNEGDIVHFDAYESRIESGKATFSWDLNNFVDSDGDGNSTNDVDATGPTPTWTYGDNGDFIVTLIVEDELGDWDTDTVSVTVLNVDPAISDVSYDILDEEQSILFRISGEKWHNVEVYLFEDDDEVGYASITRYPGSPNDQTVALADISMNFSRMYSAIAYYTPEDDSINGQEWGATPAWLILRFDNEERRIHHTFNVRHEETWIWNIEDMNEYFPLPTITFEAVAYDPGSDDLIFTWDWGDGTLAEHIYYNDGMSPDPHLSPDVNSITMTDTATHRYASVGTYTITLTVTDDDGGSESASFALSI